MKNSINTINATNVILSTDASFAELMRVICASPEAAKAAADEAEEKKEEAKEEQLRKTYGDDYEMVFGQKAVPEKAKRRPGATQLRENFTMIARIAVGAGCCEVFSNGYAIYDNGDRKCVLWVPDCAKASYYFSALRDNEKTYLPQHDVVALDNYPWHIALTVAGENRIEFNMDHPKSVGTTSDFDLDDVDVKPASSWVGGSHFDSPEAAYLKKEAAEERRKALTAKQQEICEQHFENGTSIRKIAEEYGVDYTTIREQVKSVKNKMKDDPERFFSTM